mgnify:CR=1 FL=1|jgi:hypothetical protein
MDAVNIPPSLQQALDTLERDLLRQPQHLGEATTALRRALTGLNRNTNALSTEALTALRQRCSRLAEIARLRLQTTSRLQAAITPVPLDARTYSRRG